MLALIHRLRGPHTTLLLWTQVCLAGQVGKQETWQVKGMYWPRLQALDLDSGSSWLTPRKQVSMKPASEGCVQSMREVLLGPVQKKKCCFSKNYKRIPDSGLGGGIPSVLLPVTPGPRSLQPSANREAELGVGKNPRCQGPSV